MRIGDFGFFYHSQTEKSVVGVVSTIAKGHQDNTTDDERWVCVDIVALKSIVQPVTLEAINTDGRLDDMILVRKSRLSVQPVTLLEWAIVSSLAGISDFMIRKFFLTASSSSGLDPATIDASTL